MATLTLEERISYLEKELVKVGDAVRSLSYQSGPADFFRVEGQCQDFAVHAGRLIALVSDYFKMAEIKAGRGIIGIQIKFLWREFDRVFGRKKPIWIFGRKTIFMRFSEGFKKAISGDIEGGLVTLNTGIGIFERVAGDLIVHARDVIELWKSLDPFDKTLTIVESMGLDRNWMIACVCLATQETAAKRKIKDLGKTYDGRRGQPSVFRQLEKAYESEEKHSPAIVSVVDRWREARGGVIHAAKKTSELETNNVLQNTDALIKALFASTE